jgi:hypothetical protein
MTTVNAAEIYAKLLATENISVIRARVNTASFDIKNRVLTLPQWKDMSPIVEGMLIGHEVGHALYTTDEYLDPIQEDSKMRGYLNILEDVRIEKLMKRKYPGIRKTMNMGYKELNDKDFFGVKKVPDLSTISLIDRINLYFKAGYDCGVKFTPEEKQLVVRAEKTETIEEVVQLAKEVYEYSKVKAVERKKEAMASNPSDLKDIQEQLEEENEDEFVMVETDYDNDTDTPFYDEEEGEEKDADVRKYMAGRREDQPEKTVEEKIEEEAEKEIEAKTEETFTERLTELADDSTEYVYYTLDEHHMIDPVITFKRIIEETESTDDFYTEADRASLAKFKVESSRIVNYLIKEFEMRKSASLYKRAQTSKIGSLDMGKVWSYKLNDDLFKRVTVMPKGKNHGMVFLLDWSGSMDAVIEDTIQQVVNLAMFCNRAQIPYQVFAFTTQYDKYTGQYDYEKMYAKRAEFLSKKNVLGNAINDSFSLLELFSSKMSNVEFNTMVRRLYRPWYFMRNKGYNMGGTPLNEALSFMLSYLPKFAKAHNIEKMSLITLTDGEGGSLATSNGRYIEERRYTYDTHKTIKVKNFLKDPKTKKDYPIDRYGPTQTEAILRMIKDRVNVTTVGFYICRNTRRELSNAIQNNLPGFSGSTDQMIDSMRSDFKESGFYSIKNSGRDDLFIVPQNRLVVDDGELVVDEQQTAKQIARMFTKQMSGRKTSRVLLNTFIGYVA